MHWHEHLSDVLGVRDVVEDLEQQAQGLHLAERDAELADRTRGEYARIGFAARMHASLGRPLTVGVVGVGVLDGVLRQVGRDWLLLGAGEAAPEWIVRFAAVRQVRGVAARAVAEPAWPVTARLGLAGALRRVAEGAGPVTAHHMDGLHSNGFVARVGEDFVELARTRVAASAGDGSDVELVRFGTLAALRER